MANFLSEETDQLMNQMQSRFQRLYLNVSERDSQDRQLPATNPVEHEILHLLGLPRYFTLTMRILEDVHQDHASNENAYQAMPRALNNDFKELHLFNCTLCREILSLFYVDTPARPRLLATVGAHLARIVKKWLSKRQLNETDDIDPDPGASVVPNTIYERRTSSALLNPDPGSSVVPNIIYERPTSSALLNPDPGSSVVPNIIYERSTSSALLNPNPGSSLVPNIIYERPTSSALLNLPSTSQQYDFGYAQRPSSPFPNLPSTSRMYFNGGQPFKLGAGFDPVLPPYIMSEYISQPSYGGEANAAPERIKKFSRMLKEKKGYQRPNRNLM